MRILRIDARILVRTSTASKNLDYFLILPWGSGESERVPKSFEQN